MRHFAVPGGGRLASLSTEAKLVYTFFCVLTLAALGCSLLLYEDLVGPTLRRGHPSLGRVWQYYAAEAGPAGAADPAAAALGKGPEIALPPEQDGQGRQPLTVTIPYRKLLEVTHFHLFTVPVFLLIISHLFMLTGASRRAKIGWIVLGWLASTLHLLAPWMIRYGGFAFLYPLSGGGLFLSGTVLTVYPAVAMWRPPARARTEKEGS